MSVWSELADRLKGFSPALKAALIGLLLLIFLIPLALVHDLVRERESTRAQAEAEILGTWGGEVIVGGPLMAIPYRVRERDAEGVWRERTEQAVFLPERLDIEGVVDPQVRSRGIYHVAVYTTELRVTGSFARPDFREWGIEEADILWDQAELLLELPDMRVLRDAVRLTWEDGVLPFEAGRGRAGIAPGAVRARLPEVRRPGERAFSLSLSLRGGRSLSFLPLGRETRVRLSSSWPSPSFAGAFLPEQRTLREDGFEADWYVLSLARGYPTRWRAGEVAGAEILRSSFGFRLMLPVDAYHKTERAVKYGILFVLLPFLIFFLFEAFGRARIHAMQYVLAGCANVLFYLLLLAMAEHSGFVAAYLTAAAATVALVAFYGGSVTRSRGRGLLMGGVLAAAYLMLYLLLRSEDYALLIGAVGLFAVLAAVMILTRGIDWYALRREAGNGERVESTASSGGGAAG